jgi:LDH2 family malate/lactate/ureidoglycolate dehydrogenase
MPDGNAVISSNECRRFCKAVFNKLGVSDSHGELWADALLDASLRGVDSHGILVLPMYAAMLRSGSIDPNGTTRKLTDSGAIALLDGGGGSGFVVSASAMDLAIERAAGYGIGYVAVRNSGHFGAAAYYAMRCIPEKMIGIALTNAGPALPAWGGKTKVIGSNAMAVAAPAREEFPIVFDTAIGAAAGARIFLAGQRGERIPPDWMITREGLPTDDPGELFNGGMILPFGKYKGYGLGVVVDLLTGVISGGLYGTHARGFGQSMSQSLEVCHAFLAIDIRRFMPVEEFESRVDDLIAQIRKSEPAPGFAQVYVPGERSFLTRRVRADAGIPLHAKLVEDLQHLAQDLSLDLSLGN